MSSNESVYYIVIVPIGLLGVINSVLIRYELYRFSSHWLHCALYNVNVLLHAVLLVFGVVGIVISFMFIVVVMRVEMSVVGFPYEGVLPVCGVGLFVGVYMMELNVYWLIVPGLVSGVSVHGGVQVLIISIVLVLMWVLVFMIHVIVVDRVESVCVVIGIVLVVINGVSSSVLISVYLFLLVELISSYVLCVCMYVACVHVVWIWGHVEVYVVFIPQLGWVIMFIVRRVGVLVDENAVVVSCVNMGSVSVLTWAHHLYSVSMCSDLINLYSSVSLFIALSSVGKMGVIVSGCVFSSEVRVGSWIVIVSVGGVSGVYVTLYGINSSVHCSSVVCGHCHMIMSVGCVLSLYLCLERCNVYLCVSLSVCVVPGIVSRRVYVSSVSYSVMSLMI